MKIITGPSGSGKSEYIYKLIKKDLEEDKHVLLIVPDAEAVETEASLTSYLSSTKTDKLDVYSFSRMCNDFFRKYGGLCYNYIDKTAGKLLVFLALCNVSESLNEYKNIRTSDSAVINSLFNSIRLLKNAGVTPSSFSSALDKIQTENRYTEHTYLHLCDILSVYSAYEILLSKGFDDPYDDITRFEKMLSEHDYFASKSVYIDSFTGFTPVQYNILRHIISSADDLTVSLAYLPMQKEGESILFSACKKTYGKIKNLAHCENAEITEICLEGGKRFKSDDLRAFEKSFYSSVSLQSPPENISVKKFDDIYKECSFVSADISKRIREGARFRDFAIYVSSPSQYDGILENELDKYGIRYFVSSRTDILQKSFIRFIFTALECISSDFSSESVISYIKTGLCGLDDEIIFRLENYVGLWHIYGKYFYSSDWTMSPSGFGSQSDDDEEILTKLNEAREYIITPLYDLQKKLCRKELTCKEFTEEIYVFLTKMKSAQRLEELRQKALYLDQNTQAAELEQVWNLFFSSLRTLTNICSDEKLTVQKFSHLLSLILSEVDIGIIPTSADSVTVSRISSTTSSKTKYVYLLGMCEGLFPSVPVYPSAFSENDIVCLLEYGIEISEKSDEIAAKELFDFYKCCTSASSGVTVTYFTSSLSSETKLPSASLDSIFAFCGKFFESSPSLDISDYIYTPESSLAICAELNETAESKALKNIFSEDEKYSRFLSSFDYSIENTKESLGKDICSQFYSGDLRLSQTKIDSYTGCKFSYYCKYALNLKENAHADFDSADVGTFIHYILQKLLEDYMADNTIGSDEKEIASLCDKYINDYCSNILHIEKTKKGRARINALIKRLRRNLLPTISYMLNELRSSDFEPLGLEMSINDRGRADFSPAKIQLEDGTNAYLCGIVDRIDICEINGEKYIKLIDYKSRPSSFTYEDLDNCEGIQLFMYMISICSHLGSEYKPAAAFYVSGSVSEINTESSKDEEKSIEETITKNGVVVNNDDVLYALCHGNTKFLKLPSRANAKKITVITEEDFENTLQKLLITFKELAENMKSGNAEAVPKISSDRSFCDYCEYKFLCRKTIR